MEALVYDVHGNLPALEAVLADAQAAGAERVRPRRRLRALRRLAGGDRRASAASSRALWIRGNGERWTAHPDEAPDNPSSAGAIAAARAALGDQLVEDLARAAADRAPAATR